MRIEMRLKGLRTAALREVEAAAALGKSAEVVAKTRRLEAIEDLMRRYESLQREVEDLARGGQGSPTTGSSVDPQISEPQHDAGGARVDARAGARERGERKRSEFVSRHPELGLRWSRGVIYRSAKGRTVGIAYARESVRDKWLLGLPETGIEHAVLLCEESGGTLAPISLPPEFLRRYGRALSRAGGQMKFNIARRGRRLHLIVPGAGPVDVDPFRENFSGLT